MFNEVRTFREVLEKVRQVPVPKEVIIVDDHSSDGTRDLLHTIQKEYEGKKFSGDNYFSLKFIFQETNQGKGAAIREGVKQALGDLVVIQDADLEYDPNDYPALIKPALEGKTDVVYGSRYKGKKINAGRLFHTAVNKFLTFLSNIFTGQKLTDMETCYKIFRTKTIQGIPLRSNRFGFEPEITAKISKLGLKIMEIPITYHGRSYGQGKKINWKDGISAVFTIFKFWIMDDTREK